MLFAVLVTIVAGDALMCAAQEKVGKRMIKRGFSQLDDDLVPALVICVTVSALKTLRFG